jgi:hypothetical protein
MKHLIMAALVAIMALAGAAYAASSGQTTIHAAMSSHSPPSMTGLLQRAKAVERGLPARPRSGNGRLVQSFRCGTTFCAQGTICCFNNHNGRNYCCPRGSRCAGNGYCS